MYTALLADLHLGSEACDIPALNQVLKKLKKYREFFEDVVVLGDLVEGQLNFRNQAAHALPLPVQERLLYEFLVRLSWSLKPRRLIVLAGNHDRKHNVDLVGQTVLLVQSAVDAEVKYYREGYAVVDEMLFMHRIKNTSGSDYHAGTPLILANATALARMLEKETGKDIKLIAFGHYHKLAYTYYSHLHFLFLPSFAAPWRPLRSERAAVIINKYSLLLDNELEMKVITANPTPPEQLRSMYEENVLNLLDF